MNTGRPISGVGEKELIASVILPLVNPYGDQDLPGDDCGIVWLNSKLGICASTDRVPWDLTSFRLGIIDIEGLGYYLAVLNLSDLAAMGAKQLGVLVNLGLPSTFSVDSLEALMHGIQRACQEYSCPILGGDLSDAVEPSIAGTSIGLVDCGRVLRRTGIHVGDDVYCTSTIGLTPTAFAYFLTAKGKGLTLSGDDAELLANQFRKPIARLELGKALLALDVRITAMDNTDGAGQTLHELAAANNVEIGIDASLLPIADVSKRVADFLNLDVIDLVLGAGADFQLLGTYDPALLTTQTSALPKQYSLRRIGTAVRGSGITLTRAGDQNSRHVPKGWNYFDSVKDSRK